MTDLYAALAKAQSEIKNPEKTKTAKVKGTSRKTGKDFEMSYKYADIADVLRTALPIITKHGLSLYQTTSVKDGWVMLHTYIFHESGGSLKDSEWPVCPISADDQDKGKAMTYSRRYTACAALGIAAEEDVDGAHAGDRSYEKPAPQPIGSEAAIALQAEIDAVEADLAALLRYFGVDALPMLTEDQAKAARAMLAKKKAAKS